MFWLFYYVIRFSDYVFLENIFIYNRLEYKYFGVCFKVSFFVVFVFIVLFMDIILVFWKFKIVGFLGCVVKIFFLVLGFIVYRVWEINIFFFIIIFKIF